MNKQFTSKYTWQLYFIIILIWTSTAISFKKMNTHPRITVWIHGTNVTLRLIGKVFSPIDTIEHQLLRSIPGLHLATQFSESSNFNRIAQILSTVAPETFPLEHFYMFGWSGKLNVEDRKKSAKDLNAELNSLVKQYKQKYRSKPTITLITHSHGGNVALNLARCCSETNYHIDRIILLACPVQHETSHLLKNDLFKRAYSVHSHADLWQVLDPQGLHADPIDRITAEELKPVCKKNFFSERHFESSEKVLQIRVQWAPSSTPWGEEDIKVFPALKKILSKLKHVHKKNKDLLHVEFLLPSFLSKLPALVQQAEQKNLMKDSIQSNGDILLSV